jgi:ankyrin repeat protein
MQGLFFSIGHNELMRLLIYSGFNPHQRDSYGQTPLHLSCICGNLTSVQELCEQVRFW